MDIPDNRFVGKWVHPSSNFTYIFLDSSNFTATSYTYGWTGIGTYTFNDVRIFFDMQFEVDGDIYSYSWYTDYVLTDTYLDLPKIDIEHNRNPTGDGRYYKQ